MTKRTINKVLGYRAMLGYNQTQFAELMGLKKQTYGRKENGKTPFTDDEKMKIMDIFSEYFPHITYEELFFYK